MPIHLNKLPSDRALLHIVQYGIARIAMALITFWLYFDEV